jgi:hypothetical protein
MTTELLITLALLLVVFAALDYLLLRARRELDFKKLPLLDSLPALWNRFAAWFQHLQVSPHKTRQRNGLPAALVTAKETESAPADKSAVSQPETEPVTGEASTLAYEIPAAGGKVARVQISAEVPPDTVLHITISTDKEGCASVQQGYTAAQRRRPAFRAPRLPPLPDLRPALRSLLELPAAKLATGLFVAALGAYLLTRLIGLTDFPIYFFGDEAIQTTTASDLMRRGMRGPDGSFLPTYFQNGLYFNLSASVYLQVLPQLFFGKSIFVTRAASVLVTLLAAVCTGLMLRNFFSVKRWWLATILLSVVPAWFLHSRTAFETVLFVSFYTAFLYFYLEYRLRNPKRVFWAVLFAGLAFYSYSPGQLVLAVTGLFLLISDLKYHWQQRGTLVPAIGLLTIVAIPYLRFRLAADYSPLDHLRSLGSYLIQPLPPIQKVSIFLTEYARGLSPLYWFFENPDMARHQMRAYGNIPLWFAPFMLAGMINAIRNWRSPAHRLVLLAALAAPSGAALAEIGITRILVFVIPASMLAALGLDWMLNGLENLVAQNRRQTSPGLTFINTLSLATFTLLAGINIFMLTDALRNGPTWYTDYGLYGMQYGAKQVYQETVVPALQKDPEARFVVTPSWANGAEHFVGFFVPKELQPRIALGQVYDFINSRPTFTEKNYFVVTYQEYDKIIADPKFKQVVVRSTIPYPDGRIGFYVLNIQPADNLDEILAAEEVARRTPEEESIEWMGQTVRVLHSPLGGGRLQDLLDGDPYTLAKGDQANPVIYEFFFSQPISATELVLTTGSMRNFDVVLQVYPVGETTPIRYAQNFKDLANDPTVSIPFANGPVQFDHVFLSVRDYNQGEIAQVHIREILFR